MSESQMDDKRAFLRHTVATVAYRAARAVGGSPEEFSRFAGAVRTPGEILAHMGDLFDWALSMVRGEEKWRTSEPLPWAEEKMRFFSTLAAFDTYLAGIEPLHVSALQLFQGPVADALSHAGQIAMLRRLAGFAIPGENYYLADICAGQVGAEQPEPVVRF
jgi:hypothetical protein